MRLLKVELTRFRSRRAIVLVLIAAALLTALVAGTTIWETRPVSAADQARAEKLAAQERDQPWAKRDLRQCLKDPQGWMGPRATAEDCEQMQPQADWYLDRSQLDLESVEEGQGTAIIVMLTALLLVVGTTFAGADWASGSVSNQLLFEPRRARVWLAKAGAVFLGAAVTATVLLGAFWLTLYLVAESRGISTGATVQESIRWGAARGIVLAAGAATGAYALTMLLRHTVGTLATLFAYAVGGEILMNTLPIEGIARWSLSNNVFAWIFDGYQYYDPSLPCSPTTDMCDQFARLSLQSGAWFLGLLVLGVAMLSVLLFRRRDIP